MHKKRVLFRRRNTMSTDCHADDEVTHGWSYLGSFCYKKIQHTMRERLLHLVARCQQRSQPCLVGVSPSTRTIPIRWALEEKLR